jgi:hypothetical protein
MDLVADPETELFGPIPHGKSRTILHRTTTSTGWRAKTP